MNEKQFAVVGILLTLLLLFLYITFDLKSELNKSKANNIILSSELNSSKQKIEQLELNENQTFGSTIHIKQFDCAMMINDGDEPETFDGLDDENKLMCKAIEDIKTYQDGNGKCYFAPSSVPLAYRD